LTAETSLIVKTDSDSSPGDVRHPEKLDNIIDLLEKLHQRQLSPWFTIKEAAEYARMGESTIQRAIEQGYLRSHCPPTRDSDRKRKQMSKRLIHKDDLDRFIRNETGRGRRSQHDVVFVPR